MWRSQFLSHLSHITVGKCEFAKKKTATVFLLSKFGSFWTIQYSIWSIKTEWVELFRSFHNKNIDSSNSLSWNSWIFVFAVFFSPLTLKWRVWIRQSKMLIRKTSNFKSSIKWISFVYRRCLLCVFRFNCRFINNNKKNHWRKMHAINFFFDMLLPLNIVSKVVAKWTSMVQNCPI